MPYLGVTPTSLCEADYEHSMWLRNRANWRARAEAMAPYAPPGSHASAIVPKHVRLTDDAAIVSLCIHDKTYRSTYLSWDFDSKGEIRKVRVPIGPTILITQNGLRSLPVWNDWYIFTGGSNDAGWLLDKRSNTPNRFQGGYTTSGQLHKAGNGYNDEIGNGHPN
ncbi:hypothetical protein N7501_000569 [Penicillium viridicatum]|nr:hypothetical protein N7501_000569 [Penicillium viridicatum]